MACDRRSSSGGSPPGRPAGSRLRAWPTSTGTAGWRSSRRSTRRSSSTRGGSWAGAGRARAGSTPVGGRRSRGRRHHRHRGRRRLGHGGGVRVPRRLAAPQGRLAGVHEQRRSVPGGPWDRCRGPGRRRPGRGRGDDDQHLGQRRTGVRVRRQRAGCSSRRAVTPAWPRYNRLDGPGNDCGSTRWATTATAPTARTSPSGTSTTTPTSRSSPPSTTTRSTPSTSTGPRSSRRPGSPTASPTPPAADGLGSSSSGGPTRRSSGATTTCTTERGRARPASRGCSGPHRRPRWPTWTVMATTR